MRQHLGSLTAVAAADKLAQRGHVGGQPARSAHKFRQPPTDRQEILLCAAIQEFEVRGYLLQVCSEFLCSGSVWARPPKSCETKLDQSEDSPMRHSIIYRYMGWDSAQRRKKQAATATSLK